MTKTILLLAANPLTTERLRIGREFQEIEYSLQRTKYRDRFVLHQRLAVSPDDMRLAMLDFEPQIVHFSGHGGGKNGIILEDADGNQVVVSSESLEEFFCNFSNIECIILNACYSQIQAEVIAKHVKYVIGMHSDIRDDVAIKFSVSLYEAIGSGKSIEIAFSLACNAIRMSGLPEHLTPILEINNEIIANTDSLDSAKDYIYDVYFSYYEDFSGPWVSKYFLPLFEWLLQDSLERRPEIYSTRYNKPSPTLSLDSLQALVHSRCAVSIWSPSYFELPQAREECYRIIIRQSYYYSHMNGVQLQQLFPVVVSDGNSFPEFVRNTPILNCRNYMIPVAAFEKTKRYIEFNQALKDWTEQVAKAIRHIPKWSDQWLNQSVMEVPLAPKPFVKLPFVG